MIMGIRKLDMIESAKCNIRASVIREVCPSSIGLIGTIAYVKTSNYMQGQVCYHNMYDCITNEEASLLETQETSPDRPHPRS